MTTKSKIAVLGFLCGMILTACGARPAATDSVVQATQPAAQPTSVGSTDVPENSTSTPTPDVAPDNKDPDPSETKNQETVEPTPLIIPGMLEEKDGRVWVADANFQFTDLGIQILEDGSYMPDIFDNLLPPGLNIAEVEVLEQPDGSEPVINLLDEKGNLYAWKKWVKFCRRGAIGT